MMNLKIFYSNKYIQPALHVLFWGMLLFSPYIFRNAETWQGFSEWQWKMLALKALLGVLFYFNMYFLYPVVYKKKGISVYIASVVVTIVVVYFFNSFLSEFIDKLNLDAERADGRERMRWGRGGRRRPEPDFMFWVGWIWAQLLQYLVVIGVSFSYRLYTDHSKQEKLRKEMENENLKTELSFLRSQVSPHFIFNILNNLVSLARKKSDLLEPSLIQLSSLIRYMLYENDEEKVTLDKEIDYLKSYINLQLLRFGDDVSITFNPPSNTIGYTIEPMLLAPFVENAFKHGVGLVENPQINILLTINDETGWLDFKVMNSIAPPLDSKDKSSGIGLVNVRRRLELLYKDDFSLDIMKTNSLFITELKIKLT